MTEADHLLVATGLSKQFKVHTRWGRAQTFKALEDVSLYVDAGEVVAVVGESGSGKTTLTRCLLGVERPTAGTFALDGEPVTSLAGRSGRAFRRQVQAVFQDPWSSLDPRWTARQSVREALDCLDIGPRGGRAARVEEQLARVGLPTHVNDRRPAAMSGGQRQRVAIAAALACQPRLLIADEPVTALDVSVQAQILNLLSDLRTDMGLAILFVSHNLAVVGHISDRVIVMFGGRVVEQGPTQQVLKDPKHPYTQSLVAAIPGVGDPRPVPEPSTPDPVLSDGHGDAGCRYWDRCPSRHDVCLSVAPELRSLQADPQREVSCHLYSDDSAPKTLETIPQLSEPA